MCLFIQSSLVRLVARTLVKNHSLPDVRVAGKGLQRCQSSPALLCKEHVRVCRLARVARVRRACSSPERLRVIDDAYLVGARIAHAVCRQKRRASLPKIESGYTPPESPEPREHADQYTNPFVDATSGVCLTVRKLESEF